ncbi:MAG: PEP-CTERM sorting domain-containing protein [Phycisphaerae bacterium]|jgi:hypothetical protein
MRKMASTLALAATLLAAATTTAEIIDGVNWADEAVAYSANIQNYSGVLMDETTEWWPTGPADADVDGNGYAWDAVDQDTVAGWRSVAPGEYITLYWETGIPDLPGDDLAITLYGGPSAEADVLVSVDGDVFTSIGTIGTGTPGYFRDEGFDFGGLLTGDVHYAKVLRTASGPQTGMFFDAFAGVVPEPGSLTLLILATFALARRRC